MDRALDDVIHDRQRSNFRSKDRRPPRDGIRKTNNFREEPRNMDSDWVHDRFNDDQDEPRAAARRGGGGYRGGRGGGRRSPDREVYERPQADIKIRVDNIHYDLTEDDLTELFSRKGPVQDVQLLYDRNDRSRGTAFVTYHDMRDAKDAVHDFDGANANGQPIRLTIMPAGPPPKSRNPFDTAERPSRSLFDRIETPASGRSRSDSPRRQDRRSDVRKPPPEGIDRYVPGERSDSRRRSPLPPRRGEGRRGGDRGPTRRPGERRRRSPGKDSDGHPIVQGRPRKTQEELDAEMEDYWGSKEDATKQAGAKGATEEAAPAQATATANDDDIDMIE